MAEQTIAETRVTQLTSNKSSESHSHVAGFASELLRLVSAKPMESIPGG